LLKDGKITAALGAPPQTPVGLQRLGTLPPDPPPSLLLSRNLRVTFKHCSDFSASLKLRPNISYLSDGWAPLAKLVPLAQTSISYATANHSKVEAR